MVDIRLKKPGYGDVLYLYLELSCFDVLLRLLRFRTRYIDSCYLIFVARKPKFIFKVKYCGTTRVGGPMQARYKRSFERQRCSQK